MPGNGFAMRSPEWSIPQGACLGHTVSAPAHQSTPLHLQCPHYLRNATSVATRGWSRRSWGNGTSNSDLRGLCEHRTLVEIDAPR